MGKDFGVTFLGLWWAEFHAEKEMGAKMVGLPGFAVASHTAPACLMSNMNQDNTNMRPTLGNYFEAEPGSKICFC